MENTEKAHAVPQNIMSVEFKLIGDLSLKQFVFIAVPLTLGFIMYIFHVNNYITIVFTGFLLLVALFIDFVPVDDRPLDDLIVNFLIAIKNPTQRVWRKNPEFPNILKIPKMLIPQEKKNTDMATFMYQSPIDSNLNTPSSSDASKFLDQREKVLIDNIDKLNDSLNSTPAGNSMVSPSINNNIPSAGMNVNPPFVNPNVNNSNYNPNGSNNTNNQNQGSGMNQPQNLGNGNTVNPNVNNSNYNPNGSNNTNNQNQGSSMNQPQNLGNGNTVNSTQNPAYNNAQPVASNNNPNISGSAIPNMLDPLRQPDPKDFYKQAPEESNNDPINTAYLNNTTIPTIDPSINPQNPFLSTVGNVPTSTITPNTNSYTMGQPVNNPNWGQDHINPNSNSQVQNNLDNSYTQQPIVNSNPSFNNAPVQNDSVNPLQPGPQMSQNQTTIQNVTEDKDSPIDNLSEPPDTSSISVDTNAVPHSYDYFSSPSPEPSKMDEPINEDASSIEETTSSNQDNNIAEILEKLEKLEKENESLKKQVEEKSKGIDSDNINNQSDSSDTSISDKIDAVSSEDTNTDDPGSETLATDTTPQSNMENPPENNSVQNDEVLNQDSVVDNVTSAISSPSENNLNSQNSQVTSTSPQTTMKKEDILKYLPDFVSNPNIISGVVMKSTGEILPDTVIIIKDSSQKPVRAIKTNQLGQFFIRTPLLSGMYNLEITYQGLNFDPIFIELNDTVKDPMLIYSK